MPAKFMRKRERRVHSLDASVTARQLSRVEQVAKWFGLPPKARVSGPPRVRWARAALVRAGEMLLISGPSGTGKTSLLRQLRETIHAPWIDLAAIELPAKPVVECFPHLSLLNALQQLSQFGLAEAHSYLATPAQLSEGQRWRLRLALAVEQAQKARKAVIAADEFAALLDRVTAMMVSHALRRTMGRCPTVAAVIATSHDDLESALQPQQMIRCDFGRMEWMDRRTRRCRTIREQAPDGQR